MSQCEPIIELKGITVHRGGRIALDSVDLVAKRMAFIPAYIAEILRKG